MKIAARSPASTIDIAKFPFLVKSRLRAGKVEVKSKKIVDRQKIKKATQARKTAFWGKLAE